MSSNRRTTSSILGRKGATPAERSSRAAPPRRWRKTRAPSPGTSCERFSTSPPPKGDGPIRSRRGRVLRAVPVAAVEFANDLFREAVVPFLPHRIEDRVGPVLVLQAPHLVHILVDGQHPLRNHEREHDAEARLEFPLVPAPVD